jgi:hypothetical protein
MNGWRASTHAMDYFVFHLDLQTAKGPRAMEHFYDYNSFEWFLRIMHFILRGRCKDVKF